jgi:hypothetical protein
VKEIEYIKKDRLVEGRNATNYFLIRYNDQTGSASSKRFSINLSNDELGKIRKLCVEMQVSLKVKETYIKG